MNLDEQSRKAIYKAVVHDSRLSREAGALPGMSSPKVRHFLNNLCGFEGCRYLEVGVWTGSTLISALDGHPALTCWAIDNWSEWAGGQNPRDAFLANLKACLPGRDPAGLLVERDLRLVDLSSSGIQGVNVMFNDTAGPEEIQYQALVHYLPVLAEQFIYIAGHWNHEPVKAGINRAIKDLGLHAIYHQVLPAVGAHDRELWWNGLGVYTFTQALKTSL